MVTAKVSSRFNEDTSKSALKRSKEGIGLRVAKRHHLEEVGGYVNDCLRRGKASGNVHFTSIISESQVGTTFVCTSNCVGGRGLRVAQDVGKNIVIAKGFGKLMNTEEALEDLGFKVYDTKETVLVLNPPTKEFPANLANTSDGSIPNNCRLLHKTGSDYVSIKTLRNLKAGEEVIVAYGSKYTKAIRDCVRENNKIAKGVGEISLFAKLTCVVCERVAQKLHLKYDSSLSGFRHKCLFPCINIAKMLQSGK